MLLISNLLIKKNYKMNINNYFDDLIDKKTTHIYGKLVYLKGSKGS
jgi:hypothetical protein